MSDQNGADDRHGLRKVPTGIPGVDEITDGGIPRSRTTLVMGGAGSGKTIFALQTLVNGARKYNEPGIFVAFEENSRHIIENAESFGWALPELEPQQLYFLDARLSADSVLAGNYDLSAMLAILQVKATEMGAKRIIFDSIDVLLILLADPTAARRELYRIHDWLAESELTGIITTRIESDLDPTFIEHFSFLQFMADCVILLSHHLVDYVSLRALRIMKYRGSGFAENEFSLVITPTGIEVASADVAEIPMYSRVFTDRLSSGVARLDTMLNGGYFRGTSTLLTGTPGTAKTSLCGAFLEAACLRGEKGLLINFDESADEVVRNLASLNIKLQRFIDAGLLHIVTIRSEVRSAEEHLLRLSRLTTEFEPSCMVIDPLSALLKASGHITGPAVAQRMINLTKQQGITLLCTSLLAGNEPEVESSSLHVSTIADTWIHLSYVAQAGERNRALTIIKSRGTGHSNQVRELVLSDQGITLTDAYSAGGVVLMGSLRAEKETQESVDRELMRLDAEGHQRELAKANTQAQANIDELQREIAARELEMARAQHEQALREQEWANRQGDIRIMRGADVDTDISHFGGQVPPQQQDTGADEGASDA